MEEHDAHRDREDLVIIPKDALIIAVNALERVDKAGISRVQLILAGDAAREAIAQIAAVLSGGG